MSYIYSLCSSSKGNSTYIGDKKSGVLVDVGISMRALKRSLEFRDIPLSAIKAIFITHEHVDHIKGLCTVGEQLKLPIYGSRDTLLHLIHNNLIPKNAEAIEINRRAKQVAGMNIKAFHTPHDCADSLGFRFELENGKAAGVCTDLGEMTDEVFNGLLGAEAVLLESNYDENMLMFGGYPYFLKQRIKSTNGHLSNADCAINTVRLLQNGTKRFILGHLSENNNTPLLAYTNSLESLTEAGAVIERDFTLTTAAVRTIGDAVEI